MSIVYYCEKCGHYLPLEHECSESKVDIKEFDNGVYKCPRCRRTIDTNKESFEVATVGSLMGNGTPHITCPQCKKCIGCYCDSD